ncbi:MAG: ribonuclease Z [Deltaproteobacteria bacterium]
MASSFEPRLVNGPFGDPGLFVGMRWQGTAALFDLGRNDGLPAGDLLRVSHIFVSHTHMDHFIGFDRVLRIFLNRDKRLCFFGPEGIGDCVAGKLRGYVWNLTENYSLVFEVTEVRRDGNKRWQFRASTGFQREELPYEPLETDGNPGRPLLVDEGHFRVRAAITDHRIPCLSFAIDEPTHLNIDTDLLAREGLRPGRWLAELKDAFRDNTLDGGPIEADLKEGGRRVLDDDLIHRLIRVTPGQKVGYVVDTRFMPANLDALLPLLHGASTIYCEASFLDADRDQAAMRYHLTAAEAGAIARMAKAERLRVFHYSSRYQGKGDRLRHEAEAAFRGRKDPGALAEMEAKAG